MVFRPQQYWKTPPGITVHRALGSKGTFTPGPGHENPVTPALSPLGALTQGALMPMFTSRFAVKIPLALLLGLVTVGSGAAEQHDGLAAANTTHNSRREDSPERWRGQLCLVSSRNCLNLERRPPRLCLLTPQQCEGEAGRLERIERAH